MVCGLGDRSLDKVKIRLFLSDLELPHCGIDLVLGKAKLLAEDRKVQQAHQHEQQRPPETKHADQRLDSHSRRLTRPSRMTRKKSGFVPCHPRLTELTYWVSTRPSITACMLDGTLEKKSKPVIAST